jgi:MOSC domain-containing protein YiiM
MTISASPALRTVNFAVDEQSGTPFDVIVVRSSRTQSSLHNSKASEKFFASKALRQVHLIPAELFASLSDAGFQVAAGDLGENITTAGLDLERMPLRTLIELGPTAIVELTGLRTPCVLIDRFQPGLKQQVLSSAETGPPFKSGVLGVVRAGGMVAAGDTARARPPSSSFRPLPAV